VSPSGVVPEKINGDAVNRRRTRQRSIATAPHFDFLNFLFLFFIPKGKRKFGDTVSFLFFSFFIFVRPSFAVETGPFFWVASKLGKKNQIINISSMEWITWTERLLFAWIQFHVIKSRSNQNGSRPRYDATIYRSPWKSFNQTNIEIRWNEKKTTSFQRDQTELRKPSWPTSKEKQKNNWTR